METLTQAALALPADARALLADRLAESLDPLLAETNRALWVADGVRRRDEVLSGTVKTIPAKAALERVRKGITG